MTVFNPLKKNNDLLYVFHYYCVINILTFVLIIFKLRILLTKLHVTYKTNCVGLLFFIITSFNYKYFNNNNKETNFSKLISIDLWKEKLYKKKKKYDFKYN